MNSLKKLFLVFFFYLSTSVMLSQDVTDYNEINNISNVSEKFEDAFYEALSSRLIENHDKAIVYLEECLKEDDTKPVLYFELGKNKYELKDYKTALVNFEKANELMPNTEIILQELQKTYFSLQKYDQTISTLKELIAINPKYKLALAKAYMYTQQYGKSLALLNSCLLYTSPSPRDA